MILLLALAAAAAAPSPEALRLGRELAEAGTLAHLLPLMETAQTAELIGDNPDLKPADQAALKATAHQVFLAGRERLMQGEGAKLRDAAVDRRPAPGRRVRAQSGGDALPGIDPQGDHGHDGDGRQDGLQGRRPRGLLQAVGQALHQAVRFSGI